MKGDTNLAFALVSLYQLLTLSTCFCHISYHDQFGLRTAEDYSIPVKGSCPVNQADSCGTVTSIHKKWSVEKFFHMKSICNSVIFGTHMHLSS